ncbi:uncharacterized protein METZ01_LOCUS40014 [marine metagenome]|jgi:uncharacterized protein YbjT (DUF2867 family)|uniref:NmrA-like domain-containing protein n=1 Tax=marine metagenome TaxID=408172 RepID=A0A381R6H6_9ZZZZ
MILITGATGKTGSAAVQELSNRNIPFRVLIRNEDKLNQITDMGGEVIIGAIEDDAALNQAMEGVQKALVLLPNSEQQLFLEKKVVDAALEANVQHIVKMSSMEAVPEATSPIPKLHMQSENYIKNSGMNWTMIKPNFFMQNLLGSGKTIVEQNKFFLPMGEGKAGMIHTKDVGTVIAKVLSEDGHEGQNYEVTGPEILSFHDVAEIFSKVLGKKVDYINVPIDEYKKTLSQFLTNQWHLDSVIDLFKDIAEGGIEDKTDTFQDLIGKSPCSLEQFIQEYSFVFNA